MKWWKQGGDTQFAHGGLSHSRGRNFLLHLLQIDISLSIADQYADGRSYTLCDHARWCLAGADHDGHSLIKDQVWLANFGKSIVVIY